METSSRFMADIDAADSRDVSRLALKIDSDVAVPNRRVDSDSASLALKMSPAAPMRYPVAALIAAIRFW